MPTGRRQLPAHQASSQCQPLRPGRVGRARPGRVTEIPVGPPRPHRGLARHSRARAGAGVVDASRGGGRVASPLCEHPGEAEWMRSAVTRSPMTGLSSPERRAARSVPFSDPQAATADTSSGRRGQPARGCPVLRPGSLHGHDGVAGELLHDAPVAADDAPSELELVAEVLAHLFLVPFRKRRETDEVDGQHREVTQLSGGGRRHLGPRPGPAPVTWCSLGQGRERRAALASEFRMRR
jgi:hypothetical protein